METNLSHKQEIENTRVGCLGSSDGGMLLSIATQGQVPRSAYKRLAICKGLIPVTRFTSKEIEWGNRIESEIFSILSRGDEAWESNPLWESKKYRGKNVRLISHPDFVYKDQEKKVLRIYECKATGESSEETRQKYKGQLFIHGVLGREIALTLGKGWRVALTLVHYNTKGWDGGDFDPKRLTLHSVRHINLFDVGKTLDIVDKFLDTFDGYYEGDEVETRLLPMPIQERFTSMTSLLGEIKERENKIEEFKRTLYAFMLEKDIKSIKGEGYSITRVDATTTKTFDYKRYLDDLREKYPRKSKRIIDAYSKTQEKRGYVSIKVKKEDKQ